MRQAMRRTIGLGGAAFVAVGTALVLTLPASAHTPTVTASCTDGQMTLSIDLESYQKGSNGKVNTVTATDQPAGGSLITLVPSGTTFQQKFTASFDASSNPATGSAGVTNTFVVKIVAWDDPKNKQGFSPTITKVVYSCEKGGGTTTTTPPPTTTTTMAPPTTTTQSPTTQPAGSTTTTTTGLVAAATTTSAAGTLPFTGVNAAFPLLIAGVLVVAGGGILLWLRLAAKRRRTES